MIHPILMDYKRDFKVVAVSENTNSFGLYQMVVVAENGNAFKTCASYLNVKKQDEILTQYYNRTKTGDECNHRFIGCELTERIESPSNELVQEIWKKDTV